LHAGGAPTLIATSTVGGNAHTIGVDDETGTAWTVLTEQDRDSVQGLRLP
jgi:hypothetical protein